MTRYEHVQNLLFWEIFVALFQLIICGLFCNFLILTPYFKAYCCKGDEISQAALHRKILQGQIKCLETFKTITNFLTFCVYLTIVEYTNGVFIGNEKLVT